VHGDRGSFVKDGMDGQIAALLAGRRPGDLTWAAPETSIREVGLLMLEAGVRHVPVGDGGRAVGVVSARAVLVVLLSVADR
jgi:predicted transcriptional regulator